MNRKSILLLCTTCLLGCSKNITVSNEEENVSLTTPISQTDFSSDDAENVFNMAVRNHCRLDNQVCTVKKVILQGDDIYGTYTYSFEEQEYIVSGLLQNVQVSNNDSSIVTIGRKEFAKNMTEMTPQETDSQNGEETKIFDIPSEVGEGQSGDVVLDDGIYKIRLMNLETGAMNFNGTFDGTGTFHLYALTLDQSQRFDIVSLEGSGSYDETTSLEAGWYYIVIERNDGTYTMNWQGM